MNEGIFDSFPELKTPRLTIRQITQNDDNSLLTILSYEVVCNYLSHNTVGDITSIKKMIDGMQRFFKEKQRIRWGIANTEDNTIIGHCVFLKLTKLIVVQKLVTA